MSRRATAVLPVLLLLALVGLGDAVIRWYPRAYPQFGDAQYVAAASRVAELLLSPDVRQPGNGHEILALATGEFYDEFAQSADAYQRFVGLRGVDRVAVVDGAGVAVRHASSADVLVAAYSQASGVMNPAQAKRFRLSMTVEADGSALKVARVELVT